MPGQVITVAQQKGGSGKTTLTAHLAVELVSLGKSVALIDTDPQGSLGRWFMARLDAKGEPDMEFATASAWGVDYEVRKLKDSHDVIFIDTPPKADNDLRHALRAADLVLVPISASAVDLWATEGVLDLAERTGAQSIAVLNRARKGTRLSEAMGRDIKKLDVRATKTTIGNRVVFAEAVGKGLTARDTQASSPASKEVTSLCQEILRELA